jgi:hypothetical protein
VRPEVDVDVLLVDSGADGEVDRLQRDEGSSRVVAAMSIASCTHAEGRLEAASATKLRTQIAAAWGHGSPRDWERREGGAGALSHRACLGGGARVSGDVGASDGSGGLRV